MLDKLEDTNDFSVPLYMKTPYEYMNTLLMDVNVEENSHRELITYWVRICTQYNDYDINKPISKFLVNTLIALKDLNKQYNDNNAVLQTHEDSMKQHYPGLREQIEKSRELYKKYKEKNNVI